MIKKIGYGLLAVFFPFAAFAQSTGLGMPSPTDRSVQLLSYVFGVVNGVLHGSGSQIMGQMFAKFNSAMLILCGVVITYTTILGILHTAQEGEFLGKKYASFFIPLRTAMGIILIAPTATGYSWIQVIIIWVVLQGVAAANSVWSAAINYLLQGGAVFVQNQSIDPASSPMAQKARTLISNLTPAMTCLALTQRAIDQTVYNSSGTIPPPSQTTSQSVIGALQSGNVSVPLPNFSSNNTTDASWSFLNGICGTLRTDSTSGGATDNQIIALKQVILDLNQAVPSFASTCGASCYDSNYNPIPCPAGKIVPNDGALCSNETTDCYPNGLVASPPNVNPYGIEHPDQTPILSWCNNSDPNQAINWNAYSNLHEVYNMAMMDYLGLTFDASNRGNGYQVDTQTLQAAAQGGWIWAGAYYFALLQTNTNAQFAQSSGVPFLVDTPGSVQLSFSHAYLDGKFSSAPTDIQGNEDKFVAWLLPFFSDNSDQHSPSNSLLNVFGNNQNTANQNQQYGHQNPIGSFNNNYCSGGGTGCSALEILLPYIADMINSFQALEQSQAGNGNPIILMMTFGSGMMTAAIAAWLAVLGLLTGIAIAAGAIPFVSLGGSMATFSGIFSPLLTAILLPLFVVGAMIVFYLPAVPFMIFTFAAIGWIVGVIEAMIAGPIVAFGVIHPEGGSDIFGRGDQALMLLLNLFLRPSLMIFGLISGIMVSYVGVWMINDGFAFVLAAIFTSATSNNSGISQIASGLIGAIAIPILYLLMVMQVINRSFQMIHLFPDKILRWLSGGIQESLGGEFAGMEKEVKGGLQQGMDTTSKMGSATVSGYSSMLSSAGGGGGGGGGGDKEEAPGGNQAAGGAPGGGGGGM